MEAPLERPDPSQGGHIRQMFVDDRNHFTVMFGMYGSVWPKVLPYCLLNMLWTAVIWQLKHSYGIDLTSSPSGHTFMGSLASFLIVTRLKIIYDHYMFNSQKLSDLYKAVRELAQYCCVLTRRDQSIQAKQWRHDVLYHAIVLLRVTMAVLEFKR
jgi:predicted membrane chloride channel (bestrophin family)